jgi:hypothetical protein
MVLMLAHGSKTTSKGSTSAMCNNKYVVVSFNCTQATAGYRVYHFLLQRLGYVWANQAN